MNPADQKPYIERTHKEVHYPRWTSKLNHQVLAPSVNSSLKSEIVNTVDPVNAFSGQSEQSNIPCSVKELQTDQSYSINEKNACVKNQPVLHVR